MLHEHGFDWLMLCFECFLSVFFIKSFCCIVLLWAINIRSIRDGFSYFCFRGRTNARDSTCLGGGSGGRGQEDQYQEDQQRGKFLHNCVCYLNACIQGNHIEIIVYIIWK